MKTFLKAAQVTFGAITGMFTSYLAIIGASHLYEEIENDGYKRGYNDGINGLIDKAQAYTKKEESSREDEDSDS